MKTRIIVQHARGLAILSQLEWLTDLKLLFAFLDLMDSDNYVYIVQAIRKQIRETTGISDASISRSLKRLLKAGIISGAKGTYQVNGELFEVGYSK